MPGSLELLKSPAPLKQELYTFYQLVIINPFGNVGTLCIDMQKIARASRTRTLPRSN